MKKTLPVFALSTFLLLLATPGFAQQEFFDINFASAGKRVSTLPGYDEVGGLVFQPDGKILVAGERNGPNGADFFLARFLPNGVLDYTAGLGSSYVVTDFNGGDDTPYAIALQPDGKVILAGTSDGNFALARYRADLTVEAKEAYGQSFYPLEIAPNPVADFLNIRLAENTTVLADVQVFDSRGRLAIQRTLPAGQGLEVRGLAPGMYFVRVVAGERAYAGKFVKQ